MTVYSYHASQEQYEPGTLLGFAKQAEACGFGAVFSSDHVQPWAPSQGHSAFTWSWLGAALQATDRLGFSTITVPGGWRYHPLVLAQALATLSAMFPGRVTWVALGSGEALNECLVDNIWPPKEVRHHRIERGADAMRRLLAGESVSQPDETPQLHAARVWCRPANAISLFGAATTAATARWVGGRAAHDCKRLGEAQDNHSSFS